MHPPPSPGAAFGGRAYRSGDLGVQARHISRRRHRVGAAHLPLHLVEISLAHLKVPPGQHRLRDRIVEKAVPGQNPLGWNDIPEPVDTDLIGKDIDAVDSARPGRTPTAALIFSL